jgi:hypothetical protein
MTISSVVGERALAAAVEGMLFALFRAMAGVPCGELLEDECFSAHHAPPPSPMFKGVWSTNTTERHVDDVVATVHRWFRERRAAAFYWWTGPTTRPEHLGHALLARGFIADLLDAPGLALPLHDLRPKRALPDGFVIKRSTTDRELQHWGEVFSSANHVAPSAGHAWTALAAANRPDVSFYVGYWRDEPVATSILLTGSEVAGMFSVATLDQMRGYGFGTAMVTVPLLDARQRGFEVAVLYSTRAGLSVYRALGFRLLPCAISRYAWVERHEIRHHT